MGVAVGRTGDGLSWELTISSTDAGMALSSVYLTIFAANGTVALTQTAFSALSGGASYQQIDTSATSVQAGDKILLTIATYPAGSSAQISDDAGILFQGTLQ